MKTKDYLLLCLAAAAFLITPSCGNYKKEIARLQTQKDSLLIVTHEQDSAKAVVDEYLETIASTLDSIRVQERILTIKTDDNGRALSKKQIRENLQLLSEVIQRQRARIEELENGMAGRGIDASSHYRSLISHLYEEIDSKNAEIERMERELINSRAEIGNLKKRVSSLEDDVESISQQSEGQRKTIAEQEQVLTAQAQKINTAYIKIGKKKDLKNAGLLKVGLFTGSQIDAGAVDLSLFTPIDIREFKEIMLSSYKPKLLTNHPSGSYKMELDKDSDEDITYLTILDAKAFWSLSKFLVIQL